MTENELIGHLGHLVEFRQNGARYRGRLMDVNSKPGAEGERNVYALVELPLTLIRISLHSRDVVQPSESGERPHHR